MTGRKSKYHTHILPNMDLIEGWCKEGISQEAIARNLGIANSTFQSYKVKFPEFAEALKKGKDLADIQVTNALFQSAVGYEVEEEHTEYIEGSKSGKAGMMPNASNHHNKKVTTIKKKIPGNVTAQIFWLKNRRPDLWQDRKELDAHISESLELEKFRATLDSMTPEEKMEMLKKMDIDGKA